jgi:hypothetical protein
MRFHVEPLDIPPAVTARRLGLKLEEFQEKLPDRLRAISASKLSIDGGCVAFLRSSLRPASRSRRLIVRRLAPESQSCSQWALTSRDISSGSRVATTGARRHA